MHTGLYQQVADGLLSLKTSTAKEIEAVSLATAEVGKPKMLGGRGQDSFTPDDSYSMSHESYLNPFIEAWVYEATVMPRFWSRHDRSTSSPAFMCMLATYC
jgi:hypothetical protein